MLPIPRAERARISRRDGVWNAGCRRNEGGCRGMGKHPGRVDSIDVEELVDIEQRAAQIDEGTHRCPVMERRVTAKEICGRSLFLWLDAALEHDPHGRRGVARHDSQSPAP